MTAVVSEADGLLDQRGRRLATAIQDSAPQPVEVVAVMCCPSHAADGAAAMLAAAYMSATVLEIPPEISGDGLIEVLASTGASILLACEEGVRTWRASGARIVVLGDGPGVRWWRMAELRASGAAFDRSRPAPPTRLRATLHPDGRWVVTTAYA